MFTEPRPPEDTDDDETYAPLLIETEPEWTEESDDD